MKTNIFQYCKPEVSSALYLICSCLVLFGCSTEDVHIEGPIEPTLAPDTIDFVFLGDSYTIGHAVSKTESWPYRLRGKLKFHGYEVAQTYLIANTGWTTRSLLDAIDQTDLSQVRDNRMVSLLIGVNNQYQRLPFEIFQEEFDLLLEEAIRIAGSVEKVFVVSIPDYGVSLFGTSSGSEISKEIDAYNHYMLNRADDYEVPFIDITRVSREMGNIELAIAPDGLHPSGFQYERWVEVMLPTVLLIVSR